MARTRTVTLLPLDRWADILGIDPLHFNQLETSIRQARTCAVVWKQFAWQESGQLSREDVALAIKRAEDTIADYLGYQPVSTWQVDERISVTNPAIPEIINVGNINPRGMHMSVKTRNNHIISGGIEAKTLIQAAVAVTLSDEDGDSYTETATISFATTVTDPEEIAVYYPGEAGRDEWEIRPLNDPITRRRSVTIAAGVATVLFAAWQIVDPDPQSILDPVAVNGDVAGNYLSTVDVYRHFNDPQQQVTLMWAPRPGLCDCGDTTCVVCAHSTQTGCLVARHYRSGTFFYRPATFNATTGAFDSAAFAVSRLPENLRLWYRHGFRNMNNDAPNLEMDTQLEQAIAYLSLTYLTRALCGCNNVEAIAKRMREDIGANIAGAGGDSISYQLGDRFLNSPWGTQRGAIAAWSIVNAPQRQVGQAVAL